MMGSGKQSSASEFGGTEEGSQGPPPCRSRFCRRLESGFSAPR